MTVGHIAGIPLIVGVTGHRDMVEEDIPAIRTQIAARLKKIEAVTKGMRRVLLSGLAEGADQIVVEEALARNWEVIAVLPMPFADYLADFTTDEKRAALTALKNRCISSSEIPWAAAQDLDITNPRDQQYREQSVFIARQSQVVIALWDGAPAPATEQCGTAYVVDLCRNGLPPIEGEVLAAPETTSMIHIPVSRRSAPERKPAAQSAMPVDPAFRQICKEFRSYNRAAAKLWIANQAKIQQSRDWLIPSAVLPKLDPATRMLIDHFACSDVLAIDRQKKCNHIVRLASLATIVGAFAQATNVLLAQTSWMIAYGVSVGLAYGLYLTLFRLPIFRFEDRYLEYRALAEALRVQVFWRTAGITAHVAEHYLQLVKTEVGWVRDALRNMSLGATLIHAERQTAVEVAEEFWIDSQVRYFVGADPVVVGGKAFECKRRQHYLDFAANAALFVGACLVATGIAANLYPLPAGIKAVAFAYSASFFLMGGVIKGYLSAMGYAEQASGYEKTGAVFRNAQRLFKLDPAHRMECLLALGKHALAENADWLIQRRKNAFKVSK